MKITVKAIGKYDFEPKSIYVSNGWLCDLGEDGVVTATDNLSEVKVYNSKEELEKDVKILIENEDIFTVVPTFTIKDGIIVDIHYGEEEDLENDEVYLN